MEENNYPKKNIATFLSAQTISLFGSSLVQYAIIWYITLKTSSGTMMTIATVCAYLPQILISLFAGVWVDKYNRKKMIMLSDSVIAITTLVLALLFLNGHNYIWLLYIALLIRSAGTGIQTPAVNAILPQIVPKENLMKVNGIYSTLLSLIMFLSPALSGAILSFTTIEVVFFIDIITAIIGVAITAIIPIRQHLKDVSESSSVENIKKGLQYIKENPFIKNILLFQLAVLFLVSPAAFLTPLLSARTFGPEVWRLSLVEMTFSLGAFFGGLIIATWGGFKDKFKTTIFAAFVYGVFMVLMGLSPFFWIYLLFNFLIGIAMPCYNSPITVIIQERVPESLQGRVFGFMQIAVSCALPMGMVVFGPIADIISVQAILILTGIAVVFVSIITQNKNRV